VAVVDLLPAVVKSLRKLVAIVHPVVDDPLILAERFPPLHLPLAGAVVDIAGGEDRHPPLCVNHRRVVVIVENLAALLCRRHLAVIRRVDVRYLGLAVAPEKILIVSSAVAIVGVEI
jgi:hypothetical protein